MRKKKWRLKPKVKNTITVIFLFLVLGISFNIGWNVYREHVLFERLEAVKRKLTRRQKRDSESIIKEIWSS